MRGDLFVAVARLLASLLRSEQEPWITASRAGQLQGDRQDR